MFPLQRSRCYGVSVPFACSSPPGVTDLGSSGCDVTHKTRVTGPRTYLLHFQSCSISARVQVKQDRQKVSGGLPVSPGLYRSPMAGIFSYESSEVDWCEDNYQHSENVVEYFNTMSSFVFFVISPVMLYLLHPYARERNLAVHLVWFMMIFVGLFSAYFHMTLSFVGQMLDELSILWVLAIGYSLWFPRRRFPSFVKDRPEGVYSTPSLALGGERLKSMAVQQTLPPNHPQFYLKVAVPTAQHLSSVTEPPEDWRNSNSSMMEHLSM
ncbi:alkaline ceramidase 1 isoform X1 [Arapaima gigas]